MTREEIRRRVRAAAERAEAAERAILANLRPLRRSKEELRRILHRGPSPRRKPGD